MEQKFIEVLNKENTPFMLSLNRIESIIPYREAYSVPEEELSEEEKEINEGTKVSYKLNYEKVTVFTFEDDGEYTLHMPYDKIRSLLSENNLLINWIKR